MQVLQQVQANQVLLPQVSESRMAYPQATL